MALARNLFLFAVFLCVCVPLLWVISYPQTKFVQVANLNWLEFIGQSNTIDDPSMMKSSSLLPRGGRVYNNSATFELLRRKYSNKGGKGLNPGLLVVSNMRTSKLLRQVEYFLTAERIKHEVYITSSFAMPNLVDMSISSRHVGRYSLVLLVDAVSIVSDETIYEIFREYCIAFGAGMMYITTPLTDPLVVDHEVKLLSLSSTQTDSAMLMVNEKPGFKYLRDGGSMHWKDDPSKLTTFQLVENVQERHLNTNEDYLVQDLVLVNYTSTLSPNSAYTSSVALIDWGTFAKGFVGLPLTTSIGKLVFLEMMQLISELQGMAVLRFLNKRYVQIDIDDVFFAPAGFNPTESDIKVNQLL